jgi:2-aminoethylphosphonate dioxygenase
MLTSKQKTAFATDGFVVVRAFYSAVEIRQIATSIAELTASGVTTDQAWAYFEDSQAEPGKRILSRIEKFAGPGRPLARIVGAGKMLDAIEGLLGQGGVLFKEKINFKLPGGGGFEAHQDMQAGWDAYAPYFVSVLISIDASTVNNGCLEVATGAHKRGLLGDRWKPLDAAQLTAVTFKHYPLAPGDALFFDSFVPHRSQPNPTSEPRRALYLTYNRLSDGDHRERYFADKRKNFPPDSEREPGKQYSYRV